MTSRRKFLFQSSLATTAFLAASPVKSISGAINTEACFAGTTGKLVFINTGKQPGLFKHELVHKIKEIKNHTSHVVLLHAGNNAEDLCTEINYDASLKHTDLNMNAEGNYRIIYRGKIKIAVITAKEDTDMINKTNALSDYLKKEKKCDLVVCLSLLGYKNKNHVDDLRLAQKTTSIDIILSGHPTNFFGNTLIIGNENKNEVIIQHGNVNGREFGNIEIGFDKAGKKRSVAINNLMSSGSYQA
jgi:hypothetical protein